MSDRKRVIWFSAEQEPAPAQIDELRRLFPRCEIVLVPGKFYNADAIIDKFEELRGDEMVAVVPLSMVRVITQRGYSVLWTSMEQVTDPNEEWHIINEKRGKIKRYRFDGFMRLVKIKMVFEKIEPEK